MQSLFGGGELGLLGGAGEGGGGGGGLREDVCGGVGWRSPPLPAADVYSPSHLPLIAAYQDIKCRLGGLERENSSIKRKLKLYEIKVKAALCVCHTLCVRVRVPPFRSLVTFFHFGFSNLFQFNAIEFN